jgi:uncharacterized protein (DUF433 family)
LFARRGRKSEKGGAMIKQAEDFEGTTQTDTSKPESAEAAALGTNLRRGAWEKTLESFTNRFAFTPVEVKPDVMGGVPLVAGSDVPLSTILWMLSVGYRVENILKEYPGLERKQLLNALAFAAELLDD